MLDNEVDFVQAVHQAVEPEIVGYFILVDDAGEAQSHGMGYTGSGLTVSTSRSTALFLPIHVESWIQQPLRLSSKLGPEVRVRDADQLLGPLAARLAHQLSNAVLGDHNVREGAGDGHDGPFLELWNDPGNRPPQGRRPQKDDPPTPLRLCRPDVQISLAPRPCHEPPPEHRLRVGLPAEVHRQCVVYSEHLVDLRESL